MTKRAVLIVLDSVGIGELPDADKFGDSGSNTLANTAKAVGGLHLPVMGQMGLGNIASIQGVPAAEKPTAAYGKMAELSQGKDTVTGHWEIAGVLLKDPLRTFPHGFPAELIEAYERAIGRKTLGNEVASGTEIIARLGGEHMRTGYPIVYTSADSVFQIAAHEEVIPIELLYEFCEKARAMLTGPWAVGRVIARPFVGEPGHFTRTERRKDYALKPPVPTALNHLAEAGVYVAAVGKIEDIYSGEGISEAVHTKSNQHGIDVTLEFMRKLDAGLIFTNLVDFDMLYGHRNDPAGYAKALEEVDGRLPEIMHLLREDDVLIITADHGCDPTTESTDHSREYVPLLVYGKKVRPVSLGVRQTFADVGATLCDLFRAKPLPLGTSMCQELGLL